MTHLKWQLCSQNVVSYPLRFIQYIQELFVRCIESPNILVAATTSLSDKNNLCNQRWDQLNKLVTAIGPEHAEGRCGGHLFYEAGEGDGRARLYVVSIAARDHCPGRDHLQVDQVGLQPLT